MKICWIQIDPLPLLLANLDACGIAIRVQFGLDPQAGRRGRIGNQLNDDFETAQGAAPANWSKSG